MKWPERKRLLESLRRGQSVLIGNRLIQKEADLPEAESVVTPPRPAEPIFEEVFDAAPSGDLSAASGGPRGGGEDA
jgi:hypothetical protein